MIEGNNYKVYMHIFPNSKLYIGVTSYTAQHRWGKNGYNYKNQKLVWRAIQKYGWENIEHIILFDNLSKKQAYQMEIDYIKYFNTTDSQNGYNCSGGGEYSTRGCSWKLSYEIRQKMSKAHLGINKGKDNPMYGKHLSESTKKKLSIAGKARHPSEETKRKLSESHMGSKNPNFGIHISKKRKNEISLRMSGENSPVRKEVICLNICKIFDTVTSAAKYFDIDKSHIVKCCKNKLQSSGKLSDGTKLKWMYYEDYLKQQNNSRMEKIS